VRKVIGGWGGVGSLLDYIVSPNSIPFPLDFGFWILDLDFGLGFGTWIWDLDLGLDLGLTIVYIVNILWCCMYILSNLSQKISRISH